MANDVYKTVEDCFKSIWNKMDGWEMKVTPPDISSKLPIGVWSNRNIGTTDEDVKQKPVCAGREGLLLENNGRRADL